MVNSGGDYNNSRRSRDTFSSSSRERTSDSSRSRSNENSCLTRSSYHSSSREQQPEKAMSYQNRSYYGGGGGGGGYDNKRSYRDGPNSQSGGAKRMRRDWEDTYDPQPVAEKKEEDTPKAQTRGAILMSFKQFLATQDDSITDDAAIKKYHDYKQEFKRTELHNFFVAHKDEEWFRLKYHPEESKKMKEQYFENVTKRCEVFTELSERGVLDGAQCDIHTHSKQMIKVLDALVIRLEGGSWEEVTQLDENADESSDAIETKSAAKTDEKSEVDDSDKAKENGETNDEKQQQEGDGEVQSDSEDDGEAKEDGEKKEKPKRTELHKTSSIFLRNIAPSITVAELEVLCKRFPGFLRIGLSQPLVDRQYYRRGWISFRRDVNIKEICWNFQNIRVRECDLGAIVNRDLANRVRHVNGITAHKTVAQSDIRLATRLCQVYDTRAKLWTKKQDTDDETGDSPTKNRMLLDLPPGAEMEFGISSANPVLAGIEDFLIEEDSAEEDELLGRNDAPAEQRKVVFERDERLLGALDRIVWYLRLVHSVDFYNAGEYPHEDEMPNRAGLMHGRGATPSAKDLGADDSTGNPLLSASFVQEFSTGFANKVKPMLELDSTLPDDEINRLGKKDPEKEVEAFITANTVELAKDKWLCPLSGKKFKGPEFIRKHLLGKHADKLDEVRTEVAFFNNYLSDPKRPNPPPPEETAQAAREAERRPPPLMERESRPPPSSYQDNRGPGGGGGYQRGGWQDRSGGGYNRGGGGAGMNNYGYGNRSGGYQREGYQRREGGYQSNRGYAGGGPPRGNWQNDGPPGRRDPRDLTSYKDLDVPEEIY